MDEDAALAAAMAGQVDVAHTCGFLCRSGHFRL